MRSYGSYKRPFKIAASDALGREKRGAQTVASGTADDAVIQEVMDELTTTGGTVELSAGTFSIANAIEPRQRIWLRGTTPGSANGTGTTLLLADGKDCNMFEYHRDPTDSVPALFMRMSGFTADGNKANNATGSFFDANENVWDCYLDHLFVYSFADHGIYTKQFWGWRIDQCVVEFCGDTGVYYEKGAGNPPDLPAGSHPAIISNNKIMSNEGPAIHLHGGRARVHHNLLHTNTEAYAMLVYAAPYAQIDSNDFYDSIPGGSIHIEYTQDGILVGNNLWANGGSHAVFIHHNSQGWTLGPNTIHLETPGTDDGYAFADAQCLENTTIVPGEGVEAPLEERVILQAKNGSGTERELGDVVVVKAVAAGNEFTTTVTGGDEAVLGMVTETIADGAWGGVLIRGYTGSLKTDGTVNVNIGVLLSCNTTACSAKRAASGDMAFAIALADRSDDSVAANAAKLISPRTKQ